jgi:transcriptional regulator with XRE-family HTH domain
MENLYISIGRRVKEVRTKLDLTQEELADKAELHPSYIGQVERGSKKVSIETLQKITHALNIPLKSIFDFSDKPCVTEKDLLISEIFGILKNKNLKDRKFLTDILRRLSKRF